MKFNTNIDNITTEQTEPTAKVEYKGVIKDIYHLLPRRTQKRINKNYNLTLNLEIGKHIIEHAFIEFFIYEEILEKIPPHIKNIVISAPSGDEYNAT